MNFAFSEEQDMIRKSARDFVKGQSSLERIRHMGEDKRGYSPELWKQMAESGWLGCVFPEQYGGMGLGYVDLTCIQEELGAGLMPEPVMSNVLLGGNALLFGCNESHKSTWLPKVAAGEATITLAAYELAGRFDLTHVETTAKASGGGYVINGSKSFVDDAGTSDKIVVSARTAGNKTDADGITLFLIDAKAPGLTLTPVETLDRRRRAMMTLKDVKASEADIVGTPGKGLSVLEKAVDRATVGLCAEMLGGMQAALDMSVAYSKERIQFGKPIGSFQAIKHKAANMFVALETARSAVYYAAMAIDDDQPDVKTAISCAKALCSEAYVHVSKDAIQIHGGIGYTDECDVNLYYKRAMVAAVTFGDANYHRERYATEKGF